MQWAFFAMLGWLPSVVFGQNVLSKGVGTGPIITHFRLACAQTMLRSPEFNHRPMVDTTTVSKL